MKNAFTIAELMIVVCVIGILAALVIPMVQNQATEAKIAAARDNLRILRGVVELYAAQHRGVAPGYENDESGTTPQWECFRDQTIVQERYMRKMPENPFNNLATIRMIANGEAFPAEATGEYGWIYQPATGTVRLDWPGEDDGGVRYFDY
jgi:general secretion pathway protein G